MELPISTMVVFFVALIVAAIVIQFSTDLFGKSAQRIDENPLIKSAGDEEVILEVSSITSGQISSLAEKCYTQSATKSLKSKTCYVMHGKLAANSEDVKSSLTDTQKYSVDLTNAGNTVYIKYNTISNKVEVSG